MVNQLNSILLLSDTILSEARKKLNGDKITIPRLQTLIPDLPLHKAAAVRLQLLEEQKKVNEISLIEPQ